MPDIQLEDGTKLSFEKDPTPQDIDFAVSHLNKSNSSQDNSFPSLTAESKPSSPLNVVQSGAVGLVRDQKNLPQALQSSGVDPRRISLGNKGETLVDGIDINKVGLNNIGDFANATARGLTSNLPLLTQIGGDVAAGLLAPETMGGSLMALAAFNAATSATGEAVKQLASKGISGESFSGSDMAGQATLGASTPYVGKVLETAFNGTKMALVNTLDKVANKDGIDGLVAMSNHLISNLNPQKSIMAIEKIRGGDVRILDNSYADEAVFNNTLNKRLFGEDGNIAKNIQQTYGKSNNGSSAAKALYSDALKAIPEEDVNTILQQGSSINRMNKPRALTNLGEDLSNASNTLLEVNGKNLAAARRLLVNKASNVDVDLTDLNKSLVPDLQKIGLLQPVTSSDGRIGYKINPSFDVTSTGVSQKNIFSDLVDRFFTKEQVKVGGITPESIKAAQQESAKNVGKGGMSTTNNALGDLLSGKSGKIESVYFPESTMKYGSGDKSFYKRLANIDVQISGNEFDRMGDLSPALAGYLKGLRGKTNEVAQSVGNKSVPFFNAKYGELAETLSPITKAARSKDVLAMENYMKSLASGSSEKQLLNATDIDLVMKKSGVSLFDDLNAYRASQSIKQLESPIIRSQLTKSFANTLETAYNDNPQVGVYNAIKQAVDSALPKNKQFSDLAETHILAKDLNKDTTNIFKAGFLSHGLQIGSILGAVTGGIGGATIGGVGGTAVGLALQKPGIRKGLIELAARRGGKISKTSSPAINPKQARLIGNLINRGVVSSSANSSNNK
jgi:NACalpha-BTF3-like transcription factor